MVTWREMPRFVAVVVVVGEDIVEVCYKGEKGSEKGGFGWMD